jgi:hypothetical protein
MDEALSIEPFDPKKHKPIDTVGGMKATEYLASETSPEGTAWNIPTIWFDKDTKEPVFLGDKDTVDRAWNAAYRYEEETGIKFPRYKDIKEAETAAGNRSNKGGATKQKLGMAKGGISMALDDETEAVFKSVRGQEVDPVSGNEVPLGAEPEEVRDDIDAKLSEGEYVVPADVVKYYGVKFFEDLRAEAKRGFMQMEANGRIGGEPINEMDALPFDDSELQMMDTEEPMNKGGYMTGYAEGGMTAPSTAQAGLVTKEYIGPNGEILYAQFMNGMPLTYIPEGYVLKGASPTTDTAPVQPLDTVDTRRDKDDRTNALENAPKPVDWSDPDIGVDVYNRELDKVGGFMDTVIGGLSTVLVPGGGILYGMTKRDYANKMLDGVNAKLDTLELEDPSRKEFMDVKKRIREIHDKNADGDINVGDSFLGKVVGGVGKMLNPNKEEIDERFIIPKADITPRLRPDDLEDITKETKPKSKSTPVTNQVIADNNRRNDQNNRDTLAEAAAIASGTTGKRTVNKKETMASKVKRGGGFSKGGLASKPKKK